VFGPLEEPIENVFAAYWSPVRTPTPKMLEHQHLSFCLVGEVGRSIISWARWPAVENLIKRPLLESKPL